MHTSIAKILLLLTALTLAVPESYAKRMGSGRSVGRQSTITRQRSAPEPGVRPQPAPSRPASVPPAPAPIQRSQPDTARQAVPPSAPQQSIPRQASSPWGGFLGGALLGLGLGSLMGHRDRDPNTTNQTEGGSGDNASGNGDAQTDTRTDSAQQPEPVRQNRFGSVLLLGILALVVAFFVRRALARRR